MATVISISNQKGGVGKSVTTFSLGIGLARQGKKGLTIDVDPHTSLPISLGFPKPDEIPVTLATIISSIIENNPLCLTEGISKNESSANVWQERLREYDIRKEFYNKLASLAKQVDFLYTSYELFEAVGYKKCEEYRHDYLFFKKTKG